MDKILKSVIASMSFEDLVSSGEAVELSKQYLQGEITAEECIVAIKKLYGITP